LRGGEGVAWGDGTGPSPRCTLNNAKRSAWKLGRKREKAEYALSVYGGVVREVYEISAWAPGGSTIKVRDAHGRADSRDRFEFVGQIAYDAIRNRYPGKSVAHYFKPGAQNPMYVNTADCALEPSRRPNDNRRSSEGSPVTEQIANVQ